MADCTTAALTRRKVLMGKVQADCTPATLTDADAFRIMSDTAASFGDVTVNSRGDVASNTLSNEPDVMGLLASTISGRTELVGSGDTSVPPEVDAVLRCSGMGRHAVVRLEVAALSGPIPRRAVVVGATSTARGEVKVPALAGDDFLFVEVLSGTFAAAEVVAEEVGSVDLDGAPVSLKRCAIGAIVGGVLNAGETLTASGGAVVRVERTARNGDAFFYYTEESGTLGNGETLTIRNRSTITRSVGDPAVRKIAVDASSLSYVLRQGVLVKNAGATATGTILESYRGKEAFILYAPVLGAFTAADTASTTPASATVQSVTAEGGFTYRPKSSGFERGTFRLWSDGKQKEVYSAMGSWSLAVNANELPILSYTLLGPINQAECKDAAVDPAPIFPESVPAAFQNAEGKILDEADEVVPVGNSFSLDLGNQVAIRPDYNSPTGAIGSIAAKRAPTGSLEVEQVPEASYPLFSRFFSGSLSSLQVRFGTELGKAVWVFVDAAQYSAVEDGDQNGILTNTLSFGAKKIPGTAGDNELEVIFI